MSSVTTSTQAGDRDCRRWLASSNLNFESWFKPKFELSLNLFCTWIWVWTSIGLESELTFDFRLDLNPSLNLKKQFWKESDTSKTQAAFASIIGSGDVDMATVSAADTCNAWQRNSAAGRQAATFWTVVVSASCGRRKAGNLRSDQVVRLIYTDTTDSCVPSA